MRKKIGFIILAIPLVGLLFSLQSCLKNQLFFTYRYAITQLTIDGTPTTDTIIPVTKAGLRLWLVPERYYDRFALLDNPFISSAYAGDLNLFNDDETVYEENDSIRDIALWFIPENKDIDSSQVLNANVRYKVDGEKNWTNQVQALKVFNERSNTNKQPRYIDIDFDKFVVFAGRCFFTVKIQTKKKYPYPVYSTSVLVDLQPY